jgi:hypothetical protein
MSIKPTPHLPQPQNPTGFPRCVPRWKGFVAKSFNWPSMMDASLKFERTEKLRLSMGSTETPKGPRAGLSDSVITKFTSAAVTGGP